MDVSGLRTTRNEAENILCEFDWEWDWDLGDGYTDTQLKTLVEVHNIIKEVLYH